MDERAIEEAALEWLSEVGFVTPSAVDVSPRVAMPMRASYEDVLLEPQLREALGRINEGLPADAIDQAMRVVTRPPGTSLEENNRWFHTCLTDGIDVEIHTAEGEIRGDKAWLVDFADPTRNKFFAVSQFTVKRGNHTCRLDLVVFVNGLPIIVIELKSLAVEGVNIWNAYRQLEDYKNKIPALFTYNELMVISDGNFTRVGSLTAGPDCFSPWRSIEEARRPDGAHLEVLIKGLFEPSHLLDYLRHCVTFEEDGRSGNIVKRSAAYHQFRAIREARESVKAALKPRGDGRGGVVWHTQGSGKSLTMLMLSGALITDMQLANPTIVVVSDRNDLDGQLFGTFSAGRALLRQSPEQAESRSDLAVRLSRASGGVVFTTIQKFEERGHAVSERSNIVVFADEAHRSQYGFLDGGARWMRDAIPNATFVGFTGTPLERDDHNTPAVFGDYVDVYDIRQAIEDEATVPIYYEMRLVKLVQDEEGMAEAARQLEAAAESENEGRAVPEAITVPLEELVGAPERLKLVAREIVEHFEKRREVIEGKAMVACMSRRICMDLYDEISVLRPEWCADDDDAGFAKVVITGLASEGDRVAKHVRTEARREAIARRFRDPEDNLRLVIVCDMWLTGFDCPPLHTLYLDKPLAGHNLMQAIARVNRVFGEKPGGIIVDFLGVADELRDAVYTYTQAGGEGKPVAEIQDEAVPVMERQYEALHDFFNGFDYSGFFGQREVDRVQAVVGGADYVLGQDDGRSRFMRMIGGLSKAFALAAPREETEAIRDDLIFFQAVRAAIHKGLMGDGPPRPVDSQMAVRQVISGAIASDGIIDLFQAAGLAEPNVGILSDEFLDRLAALPYKNLALEAIRKLLNDQVAIRERVNIVQSRTFRDALELALTQYNNRAITTAQVIEELIGLARVIREAVRRGEESGLTEEELAFYDALANNKSAREVLQDETLKLIARELSDRIKSRASLDWTQRESVRADMRRTVRRLLAKYGYPPDAQESATQLIIRQAELMAQAAVGS